MPHIVELVPRKIRKMKRFSSMNSFFIIDLFGFIKHRQFISSALVNLDRKVTYHTQPFNSIPFCSSLCVRIEPQKLLPGPKASECRVGSSET